MPLLTINNLEIGFNNDAGGSRALDGISFTVNRNEIVALVGESGSGKSVTALAIMQLLPKSVQHSGGSIWFEDEPGPVDLLHARNEELQEIRGRRIGMVFQEPMSSLNPVLTCGEQVIETIRRHQHCSYREAKEKTVGLFAQVELPSPQSILTRYPHQLSGGQKQRVMIAIAICCNPALLICDEPTTALDVTVQKTILQLIRQLQQQTGMGVLFITHDLGVVGDIADRAMVMYRGKIVEQGTVHDLFHRPVHPYTRALLACRPALHAKGKRLPTVGDFMDDSGDKIPSQRQPTTELIQPRPERPKAAQPLLSVDQISVWYPSRKNVLGKTLDFVEAVDNVSFDVHELETIGIVGESGCGKTTLGRAILRLVDTVSGSIVFRGENISSLPANRLRRMRRYLQIVFQDPYSSLNPRIMIGDAIAEPLNVNGLVQNRRDRRDTVVALLEKVHLHADHYRRYPHEFSGGQRQRIVIARALALNPSLLVCDESVSALDVSVQAQVLNLLNDLRAQYGFSIIFISHDLAVIRYMADRILVMDHGRIVETGTPAEIFDSPKTETTRQLIESIPGEMVP